MQLQLGNFKVIEKIISIKKCSPKPHFFIERKNQMILDIENSTLSQILTLFDILPFIVHRVLDSCGFQWCSFHLCTFSKNSPNIQLMRFSLHKQRNSFTHAFLVTNDLSAADLATADF